MIPKTYHLRLEANLPVWKIMQSVELDEPIERDGETITHKNQLVDAAGNVPQDIVDYLDERYAATKTYVAGLLGEEDEAALILKSGTISFNTHTDPAVGDKLRGIVRFSHGGREKKYKIHENIPKFELEDAQ